MLKEHKLKCFNQNVIYICLALSGFLLCIELIFTYNRSHLDDSSIMFSYIVIIPLLFLTLLNVNCKGNCNKFRLLRKLSTSIYYTHGFLIMSLSQVIENKVTLLIGVIVASFLIFFVVRRYFKDKRIRMLLGC